MSSSSSNQGLKSNGQAESSNEFDTTDNVLATLGSCTFKRLTLVMNSVLRKIAMESEPARGAEELARMRVRLADPSFSACKSPKEQALLAFAKSFTVACDKMIALRFEHKQLLDDVQELHLERNESDSRRRISNEREDEEEEEDDEQTTGEESRSPSPELSSSVPEQKPAAMMNLLSIFESVRSEETIVKEEPEDSGSEQNDQTEEAEEEEKPTVRRTRSAAKRDQKKRVQQRIVVKRKIKHEEEEEEEEREEQTANVSSATVLIGNETPVGEKDLASLLEPLFASSKTPSRLQPVPNDPVLIRPLRCKCGMLFKHRSLYDNHTAVCNYDLVLGVCEFCGSKWRSRTSKQFKQHQEICMLQHKSSKCPTCEIVLPKDMLVEHMLKHTASPEKRKEKELPPAAVETVKCVDMPVLERMSSPVVKKKPTGVLPPLGWKKVSFKSETAQKALGNV